MSAASETDASTRPQAQQPKHRRPRKPGGSPVLILLTVPERYLTVIAAGSLVLGLWYVVTRPALGGAFMVVVSVGFNAVTRDLDAGELLVQYALLTTCAVAVGLILGFAVVPAFRPAPLRQRIESATDATEAVLGAASNGAPPSIPQVVARHRHATQKQNELVPDRERLDERQLAELGRLQSVLRDLTTMVDTATLDDASLARAGEVIHAPAERSAAARAVDPPAGATSATLWEIAEQTGAARRYLLRTLPAGG